MRKRYILLLALLTAAMLIGCGKEKDAKETTEAVGAVETTEESIPGVEDSIFDQDFETTEATQAAQGDDAQQETEGSGLQEKDPDAEDDDDQDDDKDADKETTAPTESTNATEAPVDPASMDYAKFQAMSPAEQQAFVESFESIDAFFEWYNAAKEAYEAANPPIDIGSGNIDLDDIIGK